MLLRALVPKLPHRIAPLFQHVSFKRGLTKSSVQGPLEPPLSTKTLTQYFETEVLDKYHARPALICRKEAARAHGGPPTHNLGRVSSYLAWSYEEFDRHINALARGLLSIGVQAGDRVGVIMGNNRYVSSTLNWTIQDVECHSSYAMLQWACASIGAILVTLNPAYRLTELVSLLPSYDPTTFLTSY